MGTGLIYVAIVAAWAAYLVPLLIRRHEETAAEPSVEPVVPTQTSPGARVLARRSSQGSAGVQGSVGQGSYVGQGSSVGRDGWPSDVRTDSFERPGPSPAVRRRRILVGLVALTAATSVLSVLGLASWWSLSLPSLALVVFLSSSVRVARGGRAVQAERRSAQPNPAVRRQVRGSGRDAAPGAAVSAPSIPAARRARGAQSRTAASASSAAQAAWPLSAAPGRSASPAASTWPGATDATADGTKPEVGAAADGRRGAGSDAGVGSTPAARDESWWDPVQVPLPTYVTKAKAPRTVRTVDLGVPGTWAAGRLPESEMLVRQDDSPAMLLDETEQDPPARGDQDAEADIDAEAGDRRRAVGD